MKISTITAWPDEEVTRRRRLRCSMPLFAIMRKSCQMKQTFSRACSPTSLSASRRVWMVCLLSAQSRFRQTAMPLIGGVGRLERLHAYDPQKRGGRLAIREWST